MTDGLDRSEPARETIDRRWSSRSSSNSGLTAVTSCAQCYVSVGGRARARRGDRRDDPRPGAPHRRSDALVLVGQAAHHRRAPPALGARAARARRSRRRLHRRLGQREGALHAPPRAHPHRRLSRCSATSPSTRTSRTQETIRRIAAHPADWVPGTAASYHPVTGWKVLGAIVEAVDGRPIDRYLHEEIIVPARHDELVARDPARRAAGARRSHRAGRVDGPSAARTSTATVRSAWLPTASTSCTTSRGTSPRSSPAVGCAGPARELGRFYESLLGYGPTRLLEPRTVEVMGAVHRHGPARSAVRHRSRVRPRRGRRLHRRGRTTRVRAQRDGVVTRAGRSRGRSRDGRASATGFPTRSPPNAGTPTSPTRSTPRSATGRSRFRRSIGPERAVAIST